MPMFVKMGLGGTGFLGKKEKSARAARKWRARRIIEDGFPVLEPFHSVEQAREYLQGDKIVCLLCGKSFRTLGLHLLMIHDVSIDEYKKFYKIPWTYKLACVENRKAHRDYVMTHQKLLPQWGAAGHSLDFVITPSRNRRKCPFKNDVARYNGKHGKCRSRPLVLLEDGNTITYTQWREQQKSKYMSPEHRAKMSASARSRPQVDIIRNWWKGKKQSPEHLRKRMESTRKTKEQKK